MIVDNIVLYILFLLSVAGSVSILLEQLKPILFDKILEKSGQNVYLISVYGFRTFAAFSGIALLGGYPVLVALVPLFAKMPEVGVLAVSSLLVALGSDYLHVILDFLYAVRDGSRGETPAGSSTGDGSTNVTVNAPADTSAADIDALVKHLGIKPAIKDGGTVSVTDVMDALG